MQQMIAGVFIELSGKLSSVDSAQLDALTTPSDYFEEALNCDASNDIAMLGLPQEIKR